MGIRGCVAGFLKDSLLLQKLEHSPGVTLGFFDVALMLDRVTVDVSLP